MNSRCFSVFRGTAKNCTKELQTKLLFCPLDFMFSRDFVFLAVIVCLRCLIPFYKVVGVWPIKSPNIDSVCFQPLKHSQFACWWKRSMISSEKKHYVVRKRVEKFEVEVGQNLQIPSKSFSIHRHGKIQRRFHGSENVQWRWYSSFSTCIVTF